MANQTLTPQRPEYYVQTGSMFENPYGVPHDEIVAMILELPSEMAAQVIFGKYVESSGLVFSGELIQMLIDRDGWSYDGEPVPLITGDRWWHEPTLVQARAMTQDQKKLSFATGIDWARLNDYTVLTTLDCRHRPARVVAYRRLNRVPWGGLYREAGRAVASWGPSVLCDSTGMAGDVILDALESRFYCPIHDRVGLTDQGMKCRDRNGDPLATSGVRCSEVGIKLACVDGYAFSKGSKQLLIEHLRSLMSVGYVSGSDEPFGWLRTPPVAQMEEEMSFYCWDDKGLDTDTVMSLGLAAWQGIELSVGESYVGGTR